MSTYLFGSAWPNGWPRTSDIRWRWEPTFGTDVCSKLKHTNRRLSGECDSQKNMCCRVGAGGLLRTRFGKIVQTTVEIYLYTNINIFRNKTHIGFVAVKYKYFLHTL